MLWPQDVSVHKMEISWFGATTFFLAQIFIHNAKEITAWRSQKDLDEFWMHTFHLPRCLQSTKPIACYVVLGINFNKSTYCAVYMTFSTGNLLEKILDLICQENISPISSLRMLLQILSKGDSIAQQKWAGKAGPGDGVTQGQGWSQNPALRPDPNSIQAALCRKLPTLHHAAASSNPMLDTMQAGQPACSSAG